MRVRTFILVVACTGCGDPLRDPAIIDDVRVIGVKVETEAQRAEPRAGELFSAQVTVVANRPQRLSVATRLCRAQPTRLGLPRCDGSALEALDASGDTSAPLVVEARLPETFEAGEDWLLEGAVCADAEVVRRNDHFGCSDQSVAREFFVRSTIPKGAANINPDLSDDLWSFDDDEWLSPPPDVVLGQACDELELPKLRRGNTAAVSFEMRGDDREELEVHPEQYVQQAREALVYAHMATIEGLERPFSTIDPDERELTIALELKLPEAVELPRDGRVEFVYWTVRDGRGGFDVSMRAFCALR